MLTLPTVKVWGIIMMVLHRTPLTLSGILAIASCGEGGLWLFGPMFPLFLN